MRHSTRISNIFDELGITDTREYVTIKRKKLQELCNKHDVNIENVIKINHETLKVI